MVDEMTNQITPSKTLVLEVRAAFVMQGISLSRWCKQNGINMPNARLCLMGAWDGEKSRALRDRIVEAAGLGQNEGSRS